MTRGLATAGVKDPGNKEDNNNLSPFPSSIKKSPIGSANSSMLDDEAAAMDQFRKMTKSLLEQQPLPASRPHPHPHAPPQLPDVVSPTFPFPRSHHPQIPHPMPGILARLPFWADQVSS